MKSAQNLQSERPSKLVIARVPYVEHKAPHHGPGRFQRFSQTTSKLVGTPMAFCVALGLVLLWGLTGPIFRYSDTWQLVINTSTTIITFLMVFVIQHTQNRDTEALRLKLDELIRAADAARNDFIEIDDLGDDELKALHEEFQRLRSRVTNQRQKEVETS
ncbi:MAG TPA: low affinity iron permease family protein [Polyangiaceae bacterium]|nr:low affinity iron permease family protein [Polyangiaceae bacterium]